MKKGENIFRRKDGRWEARYIKGYNIDGSYKHGYVYGKTYKEAKEKRFKTITELKDSKKKKKKLMMQFNDKLDEWLERQRFSVKESTYANYVNIVERHIRPELGNLVTNDIDDNIITNFINLKMDQGNLKPSTVKGIIVVLKQALSFCGIKVNVKLPKVNKKEIEVLTEEERKKLEKYIMHHLNENTIGILLSLYTGLRIGEVCALRWENIDFEKKIIFINKTVLRVNNFDDFAKSKTKLILHDAKTTNSIRIIPVNSNLIEILKDLKGNKPEGYYILSSSFRCLEPRNYYYKFKEILKACKIGSYNYHALRHTFATNCIKLGLDPKSLSEILGHSDIKITLSLYVHPSMESKHEFMNKKLVCKNH